MSTWKNCDCDCCRAAAKEIERLKEEHEAEFIRAEVKDHRREQTIKENKRLKGEINRLQAAVNALGQQVCQFHDTNPLNETVVELEKERDALQKEVTWRRAQAEAMKVLARDTEEVLTKETALREQLTTAQEEARQARDYELRATQSSEEFESIAQETLKERDEANTRVEALEAENRVVRELVEDALDRLWRCDKEGYRFVLDRCTWMMGEETPLDAEKILERLGIRIEASRTGNGDWEVRAGGRVISYSYLTTGMTATATAISELLAEAVQKATDPLLARIAALTRERKETP